MFVLLFLQELINHSVEDSEDNCHYLPKAMKSGQSRCEVGEKWQTECKSDSAAAKMLSML